MAKARWLLLSILLVALGIRVIFVLTLENKFYFPDSYQYSAMAENIIAGKGFIVSENLKAGRPPAYPSFVALCYLIFGKHLLVIRLIQALLSTLSCLLVYLIGKKVFDERTGLIAAAITAIYPFFIFFSGLILTETLFILLLLVFIYLLISLEQRNSIWLAILAGVINGITILTRSSFLLFIVFLLPFWLIKRQKLKTAGRTWDTRTRIIPYLMVVVFTIITMSPWIIRNYLMFNKFIPSTTQGGVALYETNSPFATGGCVKDKIKLRPEIAQLPEAERDVALRKEAFNWIKKHPGEFARLALIKFRRFWNIIPNNPDYHSLKYILASILSFGCVLFLALWEIIRTRSRWREIKILLLPVLYLTLLHMVFYGSIRYRLPAEPYLIILASNSISFFLGRCLHRTTKT